MDAICSLTLLRTVAQRREGSNVCADAIRQETQVCGLSSQEGQGRRDAIDCIWFDAASAAVVKT